MSSVLFIRDTDNMFVPIASIRGEKGEPGTGASFFCQFGDTSSYEIEEAMSDEKAVLCEYDGLLYFLAKRYDSTHHYFYALDHSLSQDLPSVSVISCIASAWSKGDTVKISPQAAGLGMVKCTDATKGTLAVAVGGVDYAEAVHTHAETDVTNLVSDLASKITSPTEGLNGQCLMTDGAGGRAWGYPVVLCGTTEYPASTDYPDGTLYIQYAE